MSPFCSEIQNGLSSNLSGGHDFSYDGVRSRVMDLFSSNILNGNSLITAANNHKPSQKIKYTIGEKRHVYDFEMMKK